MNNIWDSDRYPLHLRPLLEMQMNTDKKEILRYLSKVRK